ncbi:MAG TPA: pyridoxal phosphate-dependent aminotransferase [Synergistaceae bacterium]|jgi:aspartate/methionine/tyrosine aminotransferase|nr:pyridoxal phosphate-dependent aminotransferase [Synergistaceae bacterium]
MSAIKIAKRFRNIQPSGIVKIFEAAAAVRDLSNLSIGEPDFDTEPNIVDAAAGAARKGFTHYPPLPGFEDFRKEVCAYWKRHHDLDVLPEEVFITSGAIQGPHLCFQAMLDPSDEVLLPDPSFTAYYQQIKDNGGVVVSVPSRAENGFFPTAEDYETAVTPRTKILVVNSPCNPTGGVLTRKQAEGIAEVAKRHDLIVISDEIYEAFVYSGKHVPMRSIPGMAERTLVVGGLSKSHCMTGWRLGYAIAPTELLKVMITLSAGQTFGVNAPAQKGGVYALATQDEKVRERTKDYEQRVGYSAKRLNAMPGITCPEPQGAFYLFPDITGTGMTDEEMAWWLLDTAKVAVIPGSAFGTSGAGHIRVACTLSMEGLKKAFDRMEAALNNRKAKQES